MDLADYVILAILVFSLWDGYRTGFVKQLVRLFGTVIAYIAAWQFHGLLTPWLHHLLATTLFKHAVGTTGTVSHARVPAPLFGLLGTTPGTLLPIPMLIETIANALSFGIVFYVSLLLIRYVGHLLNSVFSLPVLSFVNRVMGLVAGGIVAYLLVAVVLNVASFLPTSPVRAQIIHSSLAPMFRGPVQQLEKWEGAWPSLSPRHTT